MNYSNLFDNGSLRFIYNLVEKIVYKGFGVGVSENSRQVVLLVSALIVIFLLYKLVGIVGKTMKFIISCLEW